LDTGRPMPQLRTTVIPHGTYAFTAANENREEIRRRLQLPENARVMLSFGHIRDGKNLDLVLHAMKQVSDIHLVVAGRPQSSRQKQPHFYQRLAKDLGVADRCRWIINFIPEGEVGNLFVASDVVLLAYGHGFRSASGVLNAAVFFRKPCLASGGSGNLRTMIQKYDLGTWIEPDNIDSLTTGIRKAMYEPPSPRWDAYEAVNSWEANAAIVIKTFFGDGR
jgi:glycosyltransferase involved in cell wall biosynthesis